MPYTFNMITTNQTNLLFFFVIVDGYEMKKKIKLVLNGNVIYYEQTFYN